MHDYFHFVILVRFAFLAHRLRPFKYNKPFYSPSHYTFSKDMIIIYGISSTSQTMKIKTKRPTFQCECTYQLHSRSLLNALVHIYRRILSSTVNNSNRGQSDIILIRRGYETSCIVAPRLCLITCRDQLWLLYMYQDMYCFGFFVCCCFFCTGHFSYWYIYQAFSCFARSHSFFLRCVINPPLVISSKSPSSSYY